MFKINISEKSGKTYKLEVESGALEGKQLNDKVQGAEVSPDLAGYEFEIKGASDKAGFTAHEDAEGIGLKKLLLSYEKGMKTRPKKEGKKARTDTTPKGLRLRKTVRGKVISKAISQINLTVLKEGTKKLAEIFPEQNKPKEAPEGVPQEGASPSEEGKAKAEDTQKGTSKKE